jgi:hypothetical protein
LPNNHRRPPAFGDSMAVGEGVEDGACSEHSTMFFAVRSAPKSWAACIQTDDNFTSALARTLGVF